MLNITPDDFISLLNGVYARVKADNVPTPQCFDVAQLWSRVVGSPPFTGATADLIYNQAGELYKQIPNTADNFPLKGDLVIWNFPHVGLATGNNTDKNSFEVAEQNDPDASEIHIKQYEAYDGVIGWLHPKLLPTDSGLPINYSDIVHGSTQWDATVAKYIPSNDPKHTDFSALQAVIGGIQSVATASGNALQQTKEDTATAQANVISLTEQLANEVKQRQDDQKMYVSQIQALKTSAGSLSQISGSYQGRITALQMQVQNLLQDKLALSAQLAVSKVGNKNPGWFSQFLSSFVKLFTKK